MMIMLIDTVKNKRGERAEILLSSSAPGQCPAPRMDSTLPYHTVLGRSSPAYHSSVAARVYSPHPTPHAPLCAVSPFHTYSCRWQTPVTVANTLDTTNSTLNRGLASALPTSRTGLSWTVVSAVRKTIRGGTSTRSSSGLAPTLASREYISVGDRASVFVS